MQSVKSISIARQLSSKPAANIISPKNAVSNILENMSPMTANNSEMYVECSALLNSFNNAQLDLRLNPMEFIEENDDSTSLSPLATIDENAIANKKANLVENESIISQ